MREALRERIAARCGAVFERASKSSEGGLFRNGYEYVSVLVRGQIEREVAAYGACSDESLRIPYFASVEYIERPILIFFAGGPASPLCSEGEREGEGATAWSRV